MCRLPPTTNIYSMINSFTVSLTLINRTSLFLPKQFLRSNGTVYYTSRQYYPLYKLDKTHRRLPSRTCMSSVSVWTESYSYLKDLRWTVHTIQLWSNDKDFHIRLQINVVLESLQQIFKSKDPVLYLVIKIRDPYTGSIDVKFLETSAQHISNLNL